MAHSPLASRSACAGFPLGARVQGSRDIVCERELQDAGGSIGNRIAIAGSVFGVRLALDPMKVARQGLKALSTSRNTLNLTRLIVPKDLGSV